jgi:hypothetical protein
MRQSNSWPPAIPESGMEFYAYLGIGPNCDCSSAIPRNGLKNLVVPRSHWEQSRPNLAGCDLLSKGNTLALDFAAATKSQRVGAFHGLETRFLTGWLRPSRWGEMTADDQRIIDVLTGYWTQFAKTGDPSGAGLPP